MNSDRFRGKVVEEILNKKSTKPSISQQFTNLSVYDISLELQQFWENEDLDGVILSFNKLKGCCSSPDDLLSCETFYPVVLPILELTLHEVYMSPAILNESVSILNDLSPSISLNKEMLEKIISNLYSILFDYDIQEDYSQVYEYIFSILITYIRRGGKYTENVINLIHYSKFMNFLAFFPQCPIQHAAIVFITSINGLKAVSIKKNILKMSQIICNNDFSNSDRIHLIKWLFDNDSHSFLCFDPQILFPFLYSMISVESGNDEEDFKENKITAFNCLITIFNNSTEVIDFDYSIIFRNLLPTDDKNKIDEIIYICSLQCITAIANIENDGLQFLSSNVNLKEIINDIFSNGHPIITQKHCIDLLNAILKYRDFFFSQIFDEDLLVPIIDLLEIDDVSLVSKILSTDEGGLFPNMIGDKDNPDELTENFFSLFSKIGGWKRIHEIEFDTSNPPVSNIATEFDHVYGNLDEIEGLSD